MRMAGLAALYGKMPVRQVLRRYGLVPFHCPPLLLHLEVSQNGHKDYEHDETHAAADYQAQPARQDRLHSQGVIGEDPQPPVHAVGWSQGAHLGAFASGRVHQQRQHGVVEGLEIVARRVVVGPPSRQAGLGGLLAVGRPVAQRQNAYQVPGARVKLGELHGAGGAIEHLAADLEQRGQSVSGVVVMVR